MATRSPFVVGPRDRTRRRRDLEVCALFGLLERVGYTSKVVQDVLKIFVISLVTSIAVLFALGPVMLRLQSGAPLMAKTESVAPTAPAEAPVALTAPNIEGMDVAEARSRWQAQGISVVEDGQQADASKPAGTIVEQRPAAGAPLPEKEVRVIVAATPETLKVPDVVGQSEDDARHALVAAGFEVPPVELVGEEAGRKQGEVVRQDPNPGAQAQPGSKVQLKVVGEVVTEVVVPSVLGKPLSQGRQVLTDAGLTLGSVTNREHPEMSGRRILDQDPAPNAKVPKGTRVNLVIVAPD